VDYVSRVVHRLQSDPLVGAVGGVQWPVTDDDAPIIGQGICLALRNPWLLGGAAYRRLDSFGAVDTVYLGAFRLQDLRTLRFDDALEANEDFELCSRVRRGGSLVWLEPGLVVGYEPRDAWRALASQYFQFGQAKATLWRMHRGRPNSRQGLALALATTAALGAVTQICSPRRLVSLAAALLALYAVSDWRTVPGRYSASVRLMAALSHATIHVSWISGIVFRSFQMDRDSVVT